MGAEDERHEDPVVRSDDEADVDVEVGEGDDPFSKPGPPKAKESDEESPPAAAPQESAHMSNMMSDFEDPNAPPPAAPVAQPVASSSPSAPSTVPNLVFSGAVLGGEIGAKSQFVFRVCDPRMTMPDSAIDLAYWIYTVHTKAEASGWEAETKQSRRYSDFLWLRDQLCADHPGAIVPPLPEKNVKGQLEKIMLTNVELLSYRQRFLTKFLAAVGVHHVLKDSPHLKAFCQLLQAEWDTYKAAAKKVVQEAAPSGVTSIVQKSKEGWFKVFKKQKAAADPGAGACDGSDPDTQRSFEERKAYAKEMEESLLGAQEKVKKHTDMRTEISKSMAELSSFLISTGELETRADAALGQDLQNSGEYTVKLSRLQHEQASKEVLYVQEVISFYIGMYRGVRDEIMRLQKMQTHVAFLADEVNASESALIKAVGEKKAKAEVTRDGAVSTHKTELERYREATKFFNAEWTKFHAIKDRDIRSMQLAFADIQVNFGKQQESLDHAPIPPAVF